MQQKRKNAMLDLVKEIIRQLFKNEIMVIVAVASLFSER